MNHSTEKFQTEEAGLLSDGDCANASPDTIEDVTDQRKKPFRSFHQRLSDVCKACFTVRTLLVTYSVVISTLFLHAQLGIPTTKYPQWRGSDLDAAHEAIKIVQKKFTTGIRSFPNGTLYRSFDPTERVYVGPPSTDIDANWDALVNLDTQSFYVMPEEATSLPGNPHYFSGSDTYQVEFEVFHSLHCLNLIRKDIHRDYYSDLISTRPFWKIHIEHCIEVMRQNIMCTADLTPLPLTWINGIMPDFEQPHTCRNFDKIVQWSKTRDATTPGIAEVNLQKLKYGLI